MWQILQLQQWHSSCNNIWHVTTVSRQAYATGCMQQLLAVSRLQAETGRAIACSEMVILMDYMAMPLVGRAVTL